MSEFKLPDEVKDALIYLANNERNNLYATDRLSVDSTKELEDNVMVVLNHYKDTIGDAEFPYWFIEVCVALSHFGEKRTSIEEKIKFTPSKFDTVLYGS